MAEPHYHVHIRYDPYPSPRSIGALTLSHEACKYECLVEMAGPSTTKIGREAVVFVCHEDCFGSRVR